MCGALAERDRGQHRRCGHTEAIQSLCRVIAVFGTERSVPGRPNAVSLRRVVSLAAAGQADAPANLVARAHSGAALTHAAVVAGREARRAAGSGAKLRTGLPRFVAHLMCP